VPSGGYNLINQSVFIILKMYKKGKREKQMEKREKWWRWLSSSIADAESCFLFFSFHFWVGITIEEKGFVPFKFPLLLLSFKCRKQWPVFVCLFGWLAGWLEII
jgi:hypothetical protein